MQQADVRRLLVNAVDWTLGEPDGNGRCQDSADRLWTDRGIVDGDELPGVDRG